MIKRAFLFAVLGAVTGAVLGAISAGAFVHHADGTSQRAAFLFAILGVFHGLVVFFCSIGDTPIIEDTRSGRLVAFSLADRFDYRHFGHRIPYIAVVFALVMAFILAPLLVQDVGGEVRSTGTRLLSGFALAFVWTGVSMLLDTVIVSKIALS